jgi:hypothetical protein
MGWTSRRVGEALGRDVGCLRELIHHDIVGYLHETTRVSRTRLSVWEKLSKFDGTRNG